MIDRNRCEGKATCLDVCPEDVFELQKPAKQELSWQSRIKLKFHGGEQAFAVNEGSCTGCELCVEHCPEKAISLDNHDSDQRKDPESFYDPGS